MKVACPRCKQGWVCKVRYRQSGEVFFICEECEALWLENQPIATERFADFQTYFQTRGQRVGWQQMEMLPEQHDKS